MMLDLEHRYIIDAECRLCAPVKLVYAILGSVYGLSAVQSGKFVIEPREKLQVWIKRPQFSYEK